MLKKAGILAAAATAGVLALSPLAFAGEGGNGDNGDNGDNGGHHHSRSHDDDNGDNGDHSSYSSSGDETTVEGNQTCTMSGDQGGNASGQQAGGANLLGGLALALPLQVQVPIGNCLDLSSDDTSKTDQTTIVKGNEIDG